MLPQQAIIPAGKETAPVEEAYSFVFCFFCGDSRAPHITIKRVHTDELKNKENRVLTKSINATKQQVGGVILNISQ